MAVQVIKWRPRGPVGFAPILTANSPYAPGVFTPFDCVDSVSIAFNSTYITHDAKCGAVDVEDFRMLKSLAATLTIAMTNFTARNLILALQGLSVVADAAPVVVTDEVLPTIPAIVGTTSYPVVALGGANSAYKIASLVVKDSTGSPLTLVSGTDYVGDLNFGTIEFRNLGSYVQPFKASYTKQNPLIVAALATGDIRRWLRFNGTNYANASKITPVNIFNVSISPSKALELEPDEYGRLELECAALVDLSRASNDPRGQFLDMALEA